MILAATLALLTAQAADLFVGTWAYRATSEDGKVVATGTLTLHRPSEGERRKYRLPADCTYLGRKKIKGVDPSKYGPHGSTPGVPELHPIAGSRKGGTIHLNLNQGWADNNIFLDGTLKGKAVEGTWGYATFAGVRVHGKFRLTKA